MMPPNFRVQYIHFLLAMFLGASCTGNTANLTPTFPLPTQASPLATILPVATSTFRPISTKEPAITQTSTSTALQLLEIESLPPGQYIVYAAEDGVDQTGNTQSSLFVASTRNVLQGRLLVDVAATARVSPNSKLVAISDFTTQQDLRIIDLTTHANLDVPECAGFLPPVAWSPESTQLALSCNDSGYGVYILWLDNGVMSPLIPSSYLPAPDGQTPELGGTYAHLVWSPDGRQLAYYDKYQYYHSESLRLFDGPYITELDCLSDISTCESKTRLISNTLEGPLAWSHDSALLAIAPWHDSQENSASGIHIFDVATKEEMLLLAGDFHGEPNSNMQWSPDGTWLALGIGTKDILLVPADGSSPITLDAGDDKVKSFVGWLNVP